MSSYGYANDWDVNVTTVVRHHALPRVAMGVASEVSCPIYVCCLAVVRFTSTKLETHGALFSYDTWVTEAMQPHGTRDWSGGWTGTASLRILRPAPPVGYQWHHDKLVNAR